MPQKRHTASEMYPIYERFRNSDQTMSSFCRAENIAPHVLQYWRDKFESKNANKSLASPSPTSFHQLKVSPAAIPSTELRLLFPDGIELVLPISYPVEGIVKLVKSYSC